MVQGPYIKNVDEHQLLKQKSVIGSLSVCACVWEREGEKEHDDSKTKRVNIFNSTVYRFIKNTFIHITAQNFVNCINHRRNKIKVNGAE